MTDVVRTFRTTIELFGWEQFDCRRGAQREGSGVAQDGAPNLIGSYAPTPKQ